MGSHVILGFYIWKMQVVSTVSLQTPEMVEMVVFLHPRIPKRQDKMSLKVTRTGCLPCFQCPWQQLNPPYVLLDFLRSLYLKKGVLNRSEEDEASEKYVRLVLLLH